MRLRDVRDDWYATQWPSGENTLRPSTAPGAEANSVAFLSRRDQVHTSEVLFFVWVNENAWPSGDQESGMWETPLPGVVRCSAAPLPSARCLQMPRSPSRSDWKAIHWPSEDQMG